MSLDCAKEVIDNIFNNIKDDVEKIEIDFIGGEPLLEFNLLKDIVSYINTKNSKIPYKLFATTNGTILTDEIKKWLINNKDIFRLILSLDGNKLTHDHNRTNSYDNIDIAFFRSTWPSNSIKMTLSEFSLPYLADNIKHVHSLGFNITGVNLFESDFDWSKKKFIKILIPQLVELVAFYAENDLSSFNQVFSKKLYLCEFQGSKKCCGIGDTVTFFDIDGKKYPCGFLTPMSYLQNQLDDILKTDFTNEEVFLDRFCYENCYIYPICSECPATGYKVNGSFSERDKRRCNMQKLLALFNADLTAKRIVKDPNIFDKETTFYTVKSIKKIRELYLHEFRSYFQ
jgi:radical SAM protein with 4Fe4S-binding SPASM domain